MTSLSIIEQPSTGFPTPKSELLNWKIQNEDYVVTQGAKATFSISFDDFAEGSGLPVSVKGVVFATDDAQAFTDTAFRSEALGALTAVNFGAMLALNAEFVDFVIKVVNNTVTVTSTIEGEYDDFNFIFGTFVIPPVITSANGSTHSNKNEFLVWNLYEGANLITGAKRVDFYPNGTNGEARINFDPAYLFSEYQPKLSLIAWPEDKFWIDIQFRAILKAQNINCQQETKQGISANYTIVNSIFQLKENDSFDNYQGAVAKWVTGNPLERKLKNNVFEVAGIWLHNDGTLRSVNPFGIEFKITLPGDVVEYVGSFPNPANKFWIVPIGTLNGSYTGLLEFKPLKVEIQVFGYLAGTGERVEYSEKLVRTFHYQDCDCEENFIYLGDRGCFDTVSFGELRAAKQTVEGTGRSYPVPLNYPDHVRGLKKIDAIQSVTHSEDFLSDPLNEWNLDMIKQLERSPQVYRIVKIGDQYKIERIRTSKATFTNFDFEGGARVTLEVIEAIDAKFHK